MKEKNINTKSAGEGNSNPDFLCAVRRFELNPCFNLFMERKGLWKLLDTCSLSCELSLSSYDPVFYLLCA